jgi:hypothetical protein
MYGSYNRTFPNQNQAIAVLHAKLAFSGQGISIGVSTPSIALQPINELI